jgi:hypothetical protein
MPTINTFAFEAPADTVWYRDIAAPNPAGIHKCPRTMLEGCQAVPLPREEAPMDPQVAAIAGVQEFPCRYMLSAELYRQIKRAPGSGWYVVHPDEVDD